jgi:methylmalonyl-CoA mutase N-terminal domain/subunit
MYELYLGRRAIANLRCLVPWDNEFGDRIACNQLLFLKESYFDKVNNPMAVIILNLTQQLQKKALALFKDIETNQGGFPKTIKRREP